LKEIIRSICVNLLNASLAPICTIVQNEATQATTTQTTGLRVSGGLESEATFANALEIPVGLVFSVVLTI